MSADLINQQGETGKILQEIINKYKEDISLKRETLESLKDSLTRLETAWDLFETTDTKIRSVPNPPIDHQYFTNNYYENIREAYHRYQGQITERTSAIEAANNRRKDLPTTSAVHQVINQPQQPIHNLTMDNFQNNELNNQSYHENPEVEIIRLYRRQNSIASSLRKLLQSLKTDQERHPIQYYQLKIKTLNDYWTQMENIKHVMWEITENPTLVHDYDELENEVNQFI